MSKDKSGPYSIGSDHWPGISKLTEEAGEVLQVCGKLLGTGGEIRHWDGSDLRRNLEDEMADVIAACQFVMDANGLDVTYVYDRVHKKLNTFRAWHRQQTKPPKAHASHEIAAAPDAGFSGDYLMCRHCRRSDVAHDLTEPCPAPARYVLEAMEGMGKNPVEIEPYALARFSGIELERVLAALDALVTSGQVEARHDCARTIYARKV